MLQIFCLSGCSSKDPDFRSQADSIIRKIEAYRFKYRKLPEKLSDLGELDTLEGPVYYQREGMFEYKVWYGAELGESEVFSSKTMKWE